MHALGRFSAIFSFPRSASSPARPERKHPAPLTTIKPAGGQDRLWPLSGATTQAAALARMLKAGAQQQRREAADRASLSIHRQQCGWRLLHGYRPPRWKFAAGRNGNRHGNRAKSSGSRDGIRPVASRFSQTVNPMLQQLSTVWHPGATATSSNPKPGSSAPAPGSSRRDAYRLRCLTARPVSAFPPDGRWTRRAAAGPCSSTEHTVRPSPSTNMFYALIPTSRYFHAAIEA